MPKYVVPFMALLMLIALVGCSSAAPAEDAGSAPSSADAPAAAETSASSEEASPEAMPTATPEPTAVPAPEPMTAHFEGQGDSIVGPFTLEAGVVSLTAEHSGSANFVVKAFGDNSEDALSINEIGSYQGERAHRVNPDALLGLRPGEHSLEVTADGAWSIDVLQEFPTSGDALPLSASGAGDSVVKWVTLEEGNYTLTANHTGSRNFIVEVYDVSGGGWELVINEIGNYSGENRLKVQRNPLIGLKAGLNAVVIQADGDWDLSISK